MTTPDLKTCCQIYPPGVQKSGGELPEGSRAHTAWLDFCNASGGEDLVKSRRAKASLPARVARDITDRALYSFQRCRLSFSAFTVTVLSTTISMRPLPFTKSYRARASAGTCTRRTSRKPKRKAAR